MGVHTDGKKLAITAEPKAIRLDLNKKIEGSLKHEIDSIIKHNEFLAKQRTKNEISQFFSKYKHGNDIHKHRKQ